MTITNTTPRKLAIYSMVVGYSRVYLQHSAFTDDDVIGKSWWTYKDNNGTLELDNVLLDNQNVTDVSKVLTGLLPDTTYAFEGAFYDAILTVALIHARFGINISERKSVKTKIFPSIYNINISSQQLDVGVGTPQVEFELRGDYDFITLEASPTGKNTWTPIYTGGTSNNKVTVSMTPGVYDFKVTGTLNLPDGTQDKSTPSLKTNVSVQYVYTPPSTPTALSFGVYRVMDGQERFDLKVSWTWDKASGPDIREFVLYYISNEEFSKTQWDKANIINSSSSLATTIANFPFNKPHKFKVLARAWGPLGESSVESVVADFTLDSTTAVESELVLDTGIEVTQTHIRSYNINNGVKEQTFNIDAATGSVAIGKLNQDGVAPVTVNGETGDVNIDGRVISNEINTASLILTNLDGKSNPVIRSSSKPSYGHASQGIWMGQQDTTGKFLLDIGDASQYIRWTGEKLLISADVQVGKPDGTSTPLSELGGGAGGGSGIYSQPLDDFTVFNETRAAEFFSNNFGREQAKFEVLTQYLTSDPNNSESKQWDGTAWVTPNLFVHGSMVVSQSITTDQIIGDSAFLNKMGVNVIYDNPAALTPNPEASYKMKIDLQNGSITIR